MARVEGEKREIMDVLGHQAAAVAGDGVQHCFIRAVGKLRHRGDCGDVAPPIAEHRAQSRRVHLVQRVLEQRADPAPRNEGELPLRIPGLLNGIGRYVPVLHLHGRVGWFRRDGRIYGSGITQYQRGLGVPVVMLPDPDKAYDQDEVIAAMWQQFEEALARAKHVFVLGHSLNDRHLVRALAQNVEPTSRIAVTVLADKAAPDRQDPSAVPVEQKVSNALQGATIIPMRFGTNADSESRRAIQAWLG
jgi:hypothetical protein